MDKLLDAVLRRDLRALAQAITLIESTQGEDRKKAELLLKTLPERKEPALRLGVTGIPGVGKSTLIERLGRVVLEKNPRYSLGVLTIDPSSPVRGGSILGDRYG